MLLDYKHILRNLLLLLIFGNVDVALANPAATITYSNATLQLARGLQMAAYMNGDADPCEDFYDAACGNWAFSHPASEAKQRTSLVGLLREFYVQKCAVALEDSYGNNESNNDSVTYDVYLANLLTNFYHSCKFTQIIKHEGFADIWRNLDLEKLEWPSKDGTTTEWYETEYDWLKMVVLAKRKFNVDAFIGFGVVKDQQHAELYRIQLGAPKLALNSSEMYWAEEYAAERESYQHYIENKLGLFYAEMPKAWAEEVALQVLQVEEKLAKALANATNNEAGGGTTLERYVAELKLSYGSFVDLSRYLQLMFDQSINEKVYETPKGYFKKLVDIIRLTPKLTLANYTFWKILDQFDYGGDKEFCINKVMNFFPHEMEVFSYRFFEDPRLMQELQITFHQLKYKLYDDLQSSKRYSWIMPQTLKTLREKLRSMRLEIIQPEVRVGLFQGGTKLTNMDAGKYFGNIINILEWQNEEQLRKWHQAEKVSDTAVATTNNLPTHYEESQDLLPIYNSKINTIQIPPIFMQPRFFWDPAYPAAIKHGTFTFLLAQQIVRGLTDDQAGDETSTSGHNVWDFASQLRFAKRTSCYAQQPSYSAKQFHNKNITDRERLKKALMDYGGLSIAYEMYEKLVADQHDLGIEVARVLPNLSITHTQQFFYAYAQLFCAAYAEEVVSEYSDLPEDLRVNGAVANVEAFAKEFHCSDTSKLNLKEKCEGF